MRRLLLRPVVWIPAVIAGAVLSGSVALAASLTVTSAKLTVTRTCVLTGRNDDSLAVQDAMVRQAAGTSNLGGTNNLEVASQNSDNNQRVYVRFDLTLCSPAIAPTATVATATLRLYNRFVEACRTYDLFRVGSAWAEGTITWNNQPLGTTVNNPPTVGRSASATIGGVGCAYPTVGYVAWDVRADVDAFVHATATNYGWMIRDDAESNASVVRVNFVPKELASTSYPAPQLVVTYIG